MKKNKLCKKCARNDDCIHEGIFSETYFTNPSTQKLPTKIANGHCPDFVGELCFEDDYIDELVEDYE